MRARCRREVIEVCIALWVILAIVITYVAFASIMAKMPPIAFMVLPLERLCMNARTGSLHLGDPVPDFTLEERTLAESCVRKLGIRIPALVDDVVNGIEAAYTGWPDRLYV